MTRLGMVQSRLRIDWDKGEIPSDYSDPYLELIRLLIEGAGLEHSLMIAYLYSLFSLKKPYHHLRGDVTKYAYLEHSPLGQGGTEVVQKRDTFLDVALEEMQHLSLVNWYLAELGASPNLNTHIFPFVSDLYPFEIDLLSLTRYAVAVFLWVESDECKLSLSPHCKGRNESAKFIKEVRQVLQENSPRYAGMTAEKKRLNHVGSLYRKIVRQTQLVAEDPPDFLSAHFPWAEWENRMSWILYQGELTHYAFFRGLFTGEAFGADRHIWDPGPNFPAYTFARRTAYSHRPNTIPDANACRLAWLADLHYWIILCLLDTAYRAGARKFAYKAIDNMTLGLWHLGRHLGEYYQVGLPFDPMGPSYTLGRSPTLSLHILKRLVREAADKAGELRKDKLLPDEYDPKLFEVTLAGIEQLYSMGQQTPAEAEFRFA
jgi:hypothetical protein